MALVKKPDEFSANLHELDIKSYWVTTLDEILQAAWPKLSDKQKAAVKTERPALGLP